MPSDRRAPASSRALSTLAAYAVVASCTPASTHGSLLAHGAGSRVAMSTFASGVSWSWADTWGSCEWSWGYAVGTAHDRAMKLRSALRQPVQRAAWLQNASTPVGELLLGLALSDQRAQNSGTPTVVSPVLGAMASGRFADEQGACESLLAHMKAAGKAAPVEGLGALTDEDARRAVAVVALECVQFETRGM
ncbi:hypothetical protein T492DRAFT_1011934 [Pavlovales sp. CCMP2436]|nr:hypothetical protein T492DRAFT_1011934 [Pavlovales sp. CCMP2436]